MDEFPTLFRTYVVNSARVVLATIDWDVYTLPDTVRNRALHVLSFALKLDEAWLAVRDLLLLMAPKMELAGYRDEWIDFLEAGLQQSQRCADHLVTAELQLLIGELYRLRSRFDLAHQSLTASVAAFAALGAAQGEARVLNQQAYLAWQQHHYATAEQLATRALALLDDADPERATSLTRLGLVALDQQRWQEAEGHHRTALQLRTVHNDRRKMAWSLQNLGYALRGQGRHAEAITCFEQAIAMLEEVADAANCATVQMNLGIVYYLAGQAAQALQVYALAEHTFRTLHDLHSLAKLYNNQGLGYAALCDWLQAEQAFLASITLHQTVGDANFRLEALYELGRVYLGQGKFNQASATFETIQAEWSQILGTPTYAFLKASLPAHLEQARQQKGDS